MQVSNTTTNYQNMNIYQQPVQQPQNSPSQPIQSDGFNEDIYNASQGNLINSKDGEIVLTPQGENNVADAKEQNSAQTQAEKEAKQDAQREYAAGYVAHKSKQSQVEIYLSVATDKNVNLGNDTATLIETLRDVQKQNNAVEAYATYAQNQKDGNPTLY